MALIYCPKCKSKINADAQVNWKCASCKKVFKVSLSRLETVLERKQKGANVSLIKCPSCGRDLDNGNEEISWSCLECGNRVAGNMMTFRERMKVIEKTGDFNKRDSERNERGFGNSMLTCRKCGHKLPNDSVFCLKCGAKVVQKVVKKRIKGIFQIIKNQLLF